MSRQRLLCVLPNLQAITRQNGRLVLERRLLSGMAAYQQHWDGTILALLEPAPESDLHSDQDRVLAGENVECDPRELPFEVKVLDFKSKAIEAEISRCAVVSASIHYKQAHLAKLAHGRRVPFVFSSELTLKTRLQIARAEGGKNLKTLKRLVWELKQEQINRRAIRIAGGLQANGTPTFDGYGPLSPNPLLFFDNRIEEDALLKNDALEARLALRKSEQKLMLVFVGRINKIKGADELVEVARYLRDMGAPFELHIFGGGVLSESISAAIAAQSLGDRVKLMGHIPFADLVPRLQRDYDLFVCCHPQGDPAMAYLETMASGLPMVGYANEALAGILTRTPVGQAVGIFDNRGLALLIRGLLDDRGRLADWSRTALAFAREHTFSKTFRRRIQHLEQVIVQATSAG